jgi:LacI family transcriptional regulator
MSTLKDVAREAGVSIITVSRVINTPEKVNSQTREIIEAAMKKLNYSQNPVAKALVSNRVGVIDVFISESIDISNPFVIHFIAGISEVLSKHMYSFLILRNRDIEHKCDGYIATGLLKNEIFDMHEYASSRKRSLVLFGHTDINDIDYIDVDNIEGSKMITEYLIDQGHRNIMMMNIDEEKDYTQDRLKGYMSALESHELPFEPSFVYYSKNNVQSGYELALEILGKHNVTALFCASDVLALGAIRAAATLGMRVPDDISIVGYDGLGQHLLTNPRITTVQQPVFEIGKGLAETMVKRLQGSLTASVRQLVKPQLVIEESVRRIRG